jgi:hypothetical protein
MSKKTEQAVEREVPAIENDLERFEISTKGSLILEIKGDDINILQERCLIATFPIPFSVDESIAQANRYICCYNNTYGSGINPEAVPDLYEALKAFDNYNGNESELIKKVREAIKKAEL